MFFVTKAIGDFFKILGDNIYMLLDEIWFWYHYKFLDKIKIACIRAFFRELDFSDEHNVTRYSLKRKLFNYFKPQFFELNYLFYWYKLKKWHLQAEPNFSTRWRGSYEILDDHPSILKSETILAYTYNLLKKKNSTKANYKNLFKHVFYTYSDAQKVLKNIFGFGFYYLRGLSFILFIDACLTDDEPLWEPIEWSLVQTWILFIFSFAWIAENLIVSRYGSYTGRDKRVWMSWYKTFWLIEGYYVLNYGLACIFFILPFYFELNYNLSFVYSWWHWYSRVFFFKFIATYSIMLIIAHLLQIYTPYINWKKGLILIIFINIFIAYLIYTHFIMAFFGYFTDPLWYQKTRPIDYVQLSHEPSRWGWGPAKKDHFTYHNVKTVFWFKNDGPFASSFLMFHLFLFICIFFLFIFWLSLLRRVWVVKELPITFTTYCVSSLKQFFYFFFFFYLLVFMSFLTNYIRLPEDFYYFLDTLSWLNHLVYIIKDYPSFLYTIIIN